jgi:outer membrane lipase/esterase
MQYVHEYFQSSGASARKLITQLFAAVMLLAFTPAFADSAHGEMYVFGDSLSDPGNVFVVTGEVSVRPYDASGIPDAPYPIGRGMTFSNGANWAQVYGQARRHQGATGPALRETRFTNYAFGGARAADSLGNPFDMGEQVAQFLSDQGGTAEPDALYAVWFGGNDIRDALMAFLVAYETALIGGGSLDDAQAAGEAAAEASIFVSITSYMDNLSALVLSGATHFLILNAPNVGLAPAVAALGPEASGLAWLLSVAFNSALDSALDSFELALPWVQLTRVDAFTTITAIVFNPGLHGLSNTVDSCITPEVMKDAICDAPKEYLFWDGLHPTRTGHQLIAEYVMEAMD